MRINPTTGWQILVPLVVAGVGLIGWQLWTLRKKPKQLLFPWIQRGGAFLLLLIMLLGPSFPVSTSSPGVRNLDVLFVVDTTASMGATDYADGKLRIEGVRSDMLALGEQLRGASFGITTFDSKATPILPYIEDYDTFVSTVGTLERELFNTSTGSSIDKPIELVTRQLKDRQALHPDRSQLLFYLGDGEQTTDAKVEDFSAIGKLTNNGAVLGYGADKGSKMLKYTGLSGEKDGGYVKTMDPASRQVVDATSKLDEKNLNTIASQLKLPYKNRNNGGEVSDLMEISKAKLLIQQGKKITLYANFYWVVAIPFTALLFWEWRRAVLELFSNRPPGSKKKRTKKPKKQRGKP